jgi:putative lipoprotein
MERIGMKASTGFAFFLVFLAGYALVNLRNMGEAAVENIPTIEELSGTAWRPSHIGEMRLDEEVSLYVQFEPGGELSGNGGCNRFFGNYQLAGATIVIDRLGMTRMACPPPVMSIEIAFIEALQSAATIARNESRMALRNAEGQATVRFDATDRIN